MISLLTLLTFMLAASFQTIVGSSGELLDEATLLGIVTEADTDEPISDAEVQIAELDIQISSDVQGAFFIQNLEPGAYTLSVAHDDYEIYESEVTLNDGDDKVIEIILNPN